MAASITLRMSRPKDEVRVFQSYAMLVEVVSATDVAAKIFVMQRAIPKIITGTPPGEPVDRFDHVASPVDLEEFPADAPELEHEMPYYRVASVTLLFRSLADLEDTWEAIQSDVQGLVDAVNTGLSDPQTVEVVIA